VKYAGYAVIFHRFIVKTVKVGKVLVEIWFGMILAVGIGVRFVLTVLQK
jgi:hypothetical protein